MAAWDTRAAELKEEMDEVIDNVDTGSVSLDEIQAEGMTIRIGGRVVKLEITEEVTLPEDELRAEMAEKFTAKLQSIKSVLNEKMSEMSYMVEQNRQDAEEKERALQRRLAEANLMPDITYDQAKRGLSVVKGGQGRSSDEADVLTWLYQGVYWPKYVDGNPIDPKYSKRMISPVTIAITTVGKRVTEVTVRQTIGLGKFNHYHRMGAGDCWGEWSYANSWETPADILSIGQRALAVLENVNSASPGDQSPAGLPRLSTLRNHVLRGEAAREVQHTVSRSDERAGVTVNDRDEGAGSVWST